MTTLSGKPEITALSNKKGLALAFVGFSSFAVSDVCVKWLTTLYTVPEILFFNHGFSALVFLCVLPFMGGVKALTQSRKKHLHALRIILNIITGLIVARAFSLLPLADVYTFLFTFPLFSALLAIPLYKQPLRRKSLGAIVLGFIGILVALQPGQQGFDTASLLPLFCSVIITLLFLVSRSMPDESAVSLGFWPVFGTSVTMGFFLPHGFFLPAPFELLLLATSGVCIASGMLCVSLAFRLAPAASVSPLQYTEMIWAILFGFVMFGDTPSLMMLTGAGLIILSGLWLVWQEK